MTTQYQTPRLVRGCKNKADKMANYYSKELKVNNEIIVIECRRYRKPQKRWSVKVLPPFNGREIVSNDLVSKQFAREFIQSYCASLPRGAIK